MSNIKKSFEALITQDYETDIKQKEAGTDKDGKTIYLKYLSWAAAHKVMKLLDTNAEVIEHEFPHYSVISGNNQDFIIEESKPYRIVGNSAMVKVSVVLFGKKETENYAVMNYRGQPIPSPSAVDINKALKRAFVKALAKHGVALYLYEGEDIPEQEKIDGKEFEKLEKLLMSLDEKTGKENKKVLLNTVNKYSKQDPRFGKKVKDIKDFTWDQSGIFKVALNKIQMEFEKEQKAKK